MNKKEVSISYTFSNINLFESIYYDWKEFYDNLVLGKEAIQKYLLGLWNELDKQLSDDRYIYLDKSEVPVTIADFDINMLKTEKGITIFAFTLPKGYYPGASKYVALALTDKNPRYFTFEYTYSDNEYVFEEFKPVEKGIKHINYGSYNFNELDNFFDLVISIVDREN
jgi:hypothetical protein